MGWKVASKKFLKSAPEPSVSHYTIGLAFVIILKFHHFKSFFLPLFTWSYFPKNWSFFFPFLFWSFSWYMSFFFPHFWRVYLLRVYVRYTGCYFHCESDYYCLFSFSVDCICFFLFSRFRSFSYLEISFLFSNFVQNYGNLKKCCSLVLFYMKVFDWFFLIFLAVSLS